jgi:site-specific DNA-cytosine methylase
VRVVGSLTGGGDDAHQSGRVYDEESIAPSLRVQDRWGGPEPPAIFMRSSSGTGNGLNYTEGMAQPLTAAHPGIDAVYIKKSRPRAPDGEGERWDTDIVSPTLNDFDNSDSRAVTLVAPTVNSNKGGGWRFDADQAESLVLGGGSDPDEDLLPDKLDSHRYRACGNAVVVNVAEWLGHRIRLAIEGEI